MVQEGTPAKRTRQRPRGLAGAYLQQAVDAVGDTGDPVRLFPSWTRSREELPSGLPAAFARLTAYEQRRTDARTATLFAALAAEAYVNEFLATMLSNRDFRAIDRLPTVEKYVVGCRLALGKALFERGREPIQTIAALFKHRDKLVHPKAGYGPPRFREAPTEPEEFTPLNAAEFVVYVAAAAAILVHRARPDLPFDVPADLIWSGRMKLLEYAAQASGNLPAFDAPSPPPLMTQIVQSVSTPKVQDSGGERQ